MNRFNVYLVGTFFAFELYDANGNNVYDLHEAGQCAEDTYGNAWTHVANGTFGMSREEWLDERTGA